MANRFLTRDEVALEIGIPVLRAILVAAASHANSSAESKSVVVPNPIGDCVPISIDPEMLTPEAMRDNLARLEQMEVGLRARMATEPIVQ